MRPTPAAPRTRSRAPLLPTSAGDKVSAPRAGAPSPARGSRALGRERDWAENERESGFFLRQTGEGHGE